MATDRGNLVDGAAGRRRRIVTECDHMTGHTTGHKATPPWVI